MNLSSSDFFRMSSIPELPAGIKYHVFLTHDWGKELGHDNHARVRRINEELQKRGFSTWFDNDRMQGNIMEQMSQGIDQSALVLVFVTRRYVEKVAGSDATDNCKLEFEYSHRRKGVQQLMLPVVMEERMRDGKTWGGAVGMALGGVLYVDMAEGGDNKFIEGMGRLVMEITSRIGKIAIKTKQIESTRGVRGSISTHKRNERQRWLVLCCTPKDRTLALTNAKKEADQLESLLAPSCTKLESCTAEQLRCQMRDATRTPVKGLVFIGHADACLASQPTLGFTNEQGGLDAVLPETLAMMLSTHIPPRGCLELVVLNGCRSMQLGHALHVAGVPFVVCWETVVDDGAARKFGEAFFRAVRDKSGYESAFEAAKTAVCTITRKGTLSTGHECNIPKYSLTDPEDYSWLKPGVPVQVRSISKVNTSLRSQTVSLKSSSVYTKSNEYFHPLNRT
jgi:hypothetical protein